MGKDRPRRKFTTEELKQIEGLAARDIPEDHIATLMGLSDRWFQQLTKDNDSVRFARRLGKAKASLKVKTKLWEKIDAGDWQAIKFQLETKEGYVKNTKLELSGPHGGPIENHEVSKEELKARVLELRRLNDLTDDE